MATKKPKIVIEISGGMVSAVRSTEDIEIVIIDFDVCHSINKNPNNYILLHEPDTITKNLSDLYEDDIHKRLNELI